MHEDEDQLIKCRSIFGIHARESPGLHGHEGYILGHLMGGRINSSLEASISELTSFISDIPKRIRKTSQIRVSGYLK